MRSIPLRWSLTAICPRPYEINPCFRRASRRAGGRRRQGAFINRAAQGYREMLLRHGFVGSMGRRGNPYDCESVGAAWRA
jgi:hypothetical protein